MTKTLPNVTALHWHIHSRHIRVYESGWLFGCVNGSCKEEVLILMLLAMCWIPLTLEPVLAYQIRYYCTCRETQDTNARCSIFPFQNFELCCTRCSRCKHTLHSIGLKVFFGMFSSAFISFTVHTHTLIHWQEEGSSAITFVGGAVDFSSLCTLFWVTIER